MDWLIGKLEPTEEIRKQHYDTVLKEMETLEWYKNGGRLNSYCGPCNYNYYNHYSKFMKPGPQSDGAKFRQLMKKIRKSKLGQIVRKNPNYTEQVDKLVQLAKLQLEKIMINKGIETLKHEISVLNMEEDKIDAEIKDIINSKQGRKMHYNREVVDFPHKKFSLIKFPIKTYNAHGNLMVEYEFPQINTKHLSIITVSTLYTYVFTQLMITFL